MAEKEAKADKEKKVEKKEKKRRIWLWILIGFVALIVIAAIPYYYTSTPKACAQCHAMDMYYKSWQKSLHGQNEVACSQCHVRPGWFPYLTYRIGFYREIFAEMFKLKLAPWGATTPGGESCTREMCHSFNRLSSRTGELKVNHRAHWKKAKIRCAKCHNGVTHPGVREIGPGIPAQKLCMKCHYRVKNKCTFCHSESRLLKKKSPH